MEPAIYYSESGCILHAWVTIPGRSSICVGRKGDPEAELIDRAVTYWVSQDAYKIKENALHIAYPEKQLYSSWLPSPDTHWEGEEGQYIYCLKDRRKNGKYQILQAIKI